MLSTLGSLIIDLRANAAGFESDMGRAARISAQRSKEIQRGVQDAMKNVVAALATAQLGAKFAAGFKGAIDEADKLGKVAQKAGIEIQKLSGLKVAAALGDLDFDSLSGGLTKLNKAIVEAKNGAKDQTAAFDALGISIYDQQGKVKGTYDLFLEMADAFAVSEDGADKAAISMTLLGKSGADMIPFLNGGSAAIREATETARKFGLIVSNETAQAADDFNDRLDLMRMASKGVFTQIAAGLLPTMNDLSQQFVDTATNANNMARATTFVDSAIKVALVSAIAAKAGFHAFGTMLGAVAAAAQSLYSGVTWQSFLHPLKLAFDMSKGAGAALDILKQGYGDAREQVSGDIEAMDKVLKAGASKLAKSSQAATEAAAPKRQLNFLKPETETEKKEKKEKEEKNKGPGAVIEAQMEAKAAQLRAYLDAIERFDEDNMSAREKAWKAWTDIKNAIVSTTVEGSEERSRLMTAADRKLGEELTRQLQEQLAQQKEIQAAYYDDLHRLREQFTQGIQGDPVARMFGVNSLDEVVARMDVMREAALQMGEGLNQAFARAGDSLADLVTNMVIFGDKGEFSVKRIAATFVVDLVRSIVRVGIQMAANQAMALVYGKAVASAALTQANAVALAWAPAAAGASLATAGGNSLPASVGLTSTYGIAQALAATGMFGGAFANGGRPPTNRVSVVGERGPELFVPDVPGSIVPNHLWGYGGRGAGGAPSINIVNRAPGLVFSPTSDGLDVSMIPELERMFVQRVAADMLDGDSDIGRSFSSRVGPASGVY